MKIYSDYTEEPEDTFEPLTDTLYRELYDLEMGNFAEDVPFYLSSLPEQSTILELGCGSGRLSRHLSAHGHLVTGIDLSLQMLKSAGQRSTTEKYVRMDMRSIGFVTQFDAVIIPYNTLNLLNEPADVIQCLEGCHEALLPGGLLLLQLHTPTDDPPSDKGPQSTFQFQMFDRPQGGKVIKEIKRTYHPDRSQIVMTEQYKIRPMSPGAENRNYSQTLQLNGWSRKEWLAAVEGAGFDIEAVSSSYKDDAVESAGLLLVKATRDEE